MPRKCYMGGCSDIAIAACLFDPKISRAWLSTIEAEEDIHPQALLLCVAHADNLSVPNTWSLTDIRAVGDPQLATYLTSQAEGADQPEGSMGEVDETNETGKTATASGDKGEVAGGGKGEESNKASGDKVKAASGDKTKTTGDGKVKAASGDKTKTTGGKVKAASGDKTKTTGKGKKSNKASGDKTKIAGGDATADANDSKIHGEDFSKESDFEEQIEPETEDKELPLLSRAFRSVATI